MWWMRFAPRLLCFNVVPTDLRETASVRYPLRWGKRMSGCVFRLRPLHRTTNHSSCLNPYTPHIFRDV